MKMTVRMGAALRGNVTVAILQPCTTTIRRLPIHCTHCGVGFIITDRPPQWSSYSRRARAHTHTHAQARRVYIHYPRLCKNIPVDI